MTAVAGPSPSAMSALGEETYGAAIRPAWKLVAALRADEPTITFGELAKRLAVNINTVRRWAEDPDYQRYEDWVLRRVYDGVAAPVGRVDVSSRFEEVAPEMQDRLLKIIEMTNDPKLEAELCQDMLDRAGYAPQRKVAAGGVRTVVLTGEAVEVFMRRAREAGLTPNTLEGELTELGPDSPPSDSTPTEQGAATANV